MYVICSLVLWSASACVRVCVCVCACVNKCEVQIHHVGGVLDRMFLYTYLQRLMTTSTVHPCPNKYIYSM